MEALFLIFFPILFPDNPPVIVDSSAKNVPYLYAVYHLQAIIQFKPLCGGDINNPEISVGGPKPCTEGATGFDITVGVGKFLGNALVYHQRTTSGGDAKVYRFSALLLKN